MPWPTVLHKYIADESDDIWSAVIQRAKSNPEEIAVQGAGYGQTALHAACYRYPPENAIKVLLDASPDAAAVQNSDGETALHLALDGASEDVQMMLLEAYPMAVSKVDKYGDSPLHLAAHSGSTTLLLRRMLEAFPEIVVHANKRGATPFFLLSRSYEYIRSVDEIKEDGEYFDEWERAMMFLKASYFGSLETPPGKIFRPLHAAAKVKCPRALLNVIVRLFPGQAMERDENGCTPLALAASASAFEEPDIEDAEDFDYHNDESNATLYNNNLSFEHRDQQQLDGNRSMNSNSNAGVIGISPNAHDRNFRCTSLSYRNEESLNLLDESYISSSSSYLLNQSTLGDYSPNAVVLLNDQISRTSVIDMLVGLEPRAARIHDSEGRLPFTRAIESGKVWNEGLRSLLWAAPQALSTRDTKTKMYPFMIAAVEHNATETTVYELIRLLPELVAIGIPADDFQQKPINTAITNNESIKTISTETPILLSENLPCRKKKPNRESISTCLNSKTEKKELSDCLSQPMQKDTQVSHAKEQMYKKRKRNFNSPSDEICMASNRFEQSKNYRPSTHVTS